MTTHKVEWFEVLGTDGKKLRGFYGELFGWKFKTEAGAAMDYGTTTDDATGIGGGVGTAPHGPGWITFYVGTDDVQASLTRAQKLGAKVLLPVMEMPDVTIAVFADPEGHPVGLVQHKK